MEGLHYPRPCGCKGIRTCLLCEGRDTPGAQEDLSSFEPDLQALWRYCCLCGSVQPPPFPGKETQSSSQADRCQECPTHHADQGFILPGIEVIPDFVTEEEEKEMVRIIEQSPWKPSQSGRYKQDYGPKPNFKRRKVKQGGFTGLPSFSKALVTRMTQLESLKDFTPIEQCHLEYTPDRGSAIDLHFDDFWLWGNRLVTLNLLSSSLLLLKLDADGTQNDQVTKSYSNGDLCNGKHSGDTRQTCGRGTVHELLIPMPRRSLLVLSDDARYKWKHAIPRNAITSRRIAVTLRELASDFLPGGVQEAVGQELVDIALSYEGSVVP